ncbi:MAG: hypothetical protein IPM37_20535 [Hahellaceae bacterium]|nr:hypothetical protein [Hahellaceae bacterium]
MSTAPNGSYEIFYADTYRQSEGGSAYDVDPDAVVVPASKYRLSNSDYVTFEYGSDRTTKIGGRPYFNNEVQTSSVGPICYATDTVGCVFSFPADEVGMYHFEEIWNGADEFYVQKVEAGAPECDFLSAGASFSTLRPTLEMTATAGVTLTWSIVDVSENVLDTGSLVVPGDGNVSIIPSVDLPVGISYLKVTLVGDSLQSSNDSFILTGFTVSGS